MSGPEWRIPGPVREEIRRLPPDLKRRVREAQREIQKNPEAGKGLIDELEGYRSYRIGKYRLIYRVEPERLVFVSFGSRRDIYERIILEIGRQKIRERAAKYEVKLRRVLRSSARRLKSTVR